MKVEGGSDTKHRDAWKSAPMLIHPLLLFGRADTHEQDIGIGRANHLLHISIFFRGERAERRRIRTGNLKPRKALQQSLAQQWKHIFATPVKENSMTLLGGIAANFEHQRGTVDTLLFPRPEGAKSPDERHAIRCGNVGFVQDPGDLGIILRHDDAVNRSDANVMRFRAASGAAINGPLAAECNDSRVTGLAD